jgi:hypothetical protein
MRLERTLTPALSLYEREREKVASSSPSRLNGERAVVRGEEVNNLINRVIPRPLVF